MKLKLIMVSIFLFVFAVIVFINTSNKNLIVQRALDKQVEILQTHYSITKVNFLNNTKSIRHYVRNHPKVIELFSQAKNATKEQRDILREELFTLLSPTYERIKHMGILQFQFVFPDNSSFLRMHKPKKFGDDLSAVRYSFKYVNETKNDMYGFEQGKTTHGFRYVFPFYDKQNNYLGAVEISLDSYALQEKLHTVNKIHTHFLVNKHIMEAKVWEPTELIQTYIPSIENKNYFCSLFNESNQEHLKEANMYIMGNIKNQVDLKMQNNEAFALYVPFEDTVKVVAFLPIRDTQENGDAAYLVSYTNNDNISSVLKEHQNKNILIFIILGFLFYFIHKNIVYKNELKDTIKEKTKKLEDNLMTMKALLDSSHDGIAMIDENNKCIAMNATGMKMYQTDDESEVIGVNVFDNVAQESISTIKKHIAQNSDEAYEIICLRKDGTPYPALIKGKTIHQDGKILRISSVLDITNIKQKEEQLLKKTYELEKSNQLLDFKVEQRTQELTNSLKIISNHVNYSKTDLDGVITEVSEMFCITSQYSRDTLIGQKHNITRHPDMSAEIFKEMWDTIQASRNWHGKIKNLTKDGGSYWSDTIIRPEYNEHNEMIGYIAIRDNITEQENLKKLNTALVEKVKIEQQYNEQKELVLIEQAKLASAGEMIANIAHQWRQPLGVITTLASGTKMHLEFDMLNMEDLSKDMDTIVQNTEYLSGVINIFRSFLSNEKVLRNIILQDEIRSSMKLVDISLKDHHILMQSQIIDTKPLYMHAVSGALIEVIINIINNAKDALLEKNIKDPWVKINFDKIDDYGVITIEDNAGGVPQEIIENIFDSYFTTKKDINGTGIGLFMSKRIVTESLNGSLYVKNTKNGAKFFIELPLALN